MKVLELAYGVESDGEEKGTYVLWEIRYTFSSNHNVQKSELWFDKKW